MKTPARHAPLRLVSLARLLAGTLAALASVNAPAAELVTNGSFETNQGAGSLPFGWTSQGSGAQFTVGVTSASPQAGAWAVRVTGRTLETDGPRLNLTSALNAAGSGIRRWCRAWVRVDDFASVRVLLRCTDANGQQPDLILAEQMVRQPGQWIAVEGGSAVTWSGTLLNASLRIEVQQLSRAATKPAAELPDYFIDGLTLDDDADGDGILDRDEPAAGFSAATADTDGDGLPDRWEQDHGFSPLANEAATDPDHDGFSNAQEFWAATDPHNAGSYPGKPANPNANAATRNLLRWLALLPSQAPARHLLVGQNISDLGSATEYPNQIDGLGAATGKYPAILSLAIEPPFDRFHIPLQIQEAETRARAHWKAGGIPLLKWALYNPWTLFNGNDQTNVDIPGLIDPAASDPSVRARNQAAHDTLFAWLAQVGDAFSRLQQDGVVVMFRPMSEMNGAWFWWGHRRYSDYAALWNLLFDYFTTTRGLNNLIWVYESASQEHAPTFIGAGSSASDYYYPGDDRVDAMCHNLYDADWVLPWDGNRIHARYPKIYGIPQAGPDHANRDGTFDNLIYLRRTEAALPRSSFFVVWNSFDGTDPTTGVNAYRHIAIVDNAHATELMNDASIFTRESLPAALFTTASPVITTPAATQVVAAGAPATFAATATGAAPLAYQWLFDGRPISGATNSTYTTSATDAGSAGLYSVQVTDAVGTATSEPVILGVTTAGKVAGAASEVGPDIVHPNGNIYDQILLEGASASVNADPGQVLRLSFLDLSDDIVQVEFSGAGTLTVALDNATGPAAPTNYHQAVAYMRGHASLVVAGADETTNLSVFSVGTATAVNPELFRSDVHYDGVADLAFIAIQSANGKFGGLRAANASFYATAGSTGIHAPGVQFTGPVYVGDINASASATPVLLLGSCDDVRITGGDLTQSNLQAVQVAGCTHVSFTGGMTSHGTALPAQANRARLVKGGLDVTAALIGNPGP